MYLPLETLQIRLTQYSNHLCRSKIRSLHDSIEGVHRHPKAGENQYKYTLMVACTPGEIPVFLTTIEEKVDKMIGGNNTAITAYRADRREPTFGRPIKTKIAINVEISKHAAS